MKLITTSWDDGHPLDDRIAELLDKYKLKGTFYVPRKNPGQEVMLEKNIIVLSGEFEIGGHTLNHVNLRQLNSNNIYTEVSGCFNWLKDLTNKEPVPFCLPFGSYRKENLPIIYSSGFKFIRTTALLSPSVKSPLTGTTLQVFNHSKVTYLKHLLKRRMFDNLWLWLHSGYTSDTLRLLDHYMHYIDSNGGCLHIWGHSWEIEAFSLWKKLEMILKHIANRNEFEYITNGTLAKYAMRGC